MLAVILGLLLSAISFADVIEAPSLLIDYDQNPSDIEWKKIETLHFEVIFPKEIEKQAQRVTHLLEVAYPLVTRSLEVYPAKIPLILQNQSTVSNGFVTLAPRRTEWYVTPAVDPELTNTEWLKTLAIHEFRHVVQFQKTRQGFNKVFEIILGEIGQALGLGLTLPPWFLEGDAVGVETALTKGGRGRLPLFERDLRALLLSGHDFDYDKAHLGSFKDYIPNHYVYGYFYTTYMRNKHGDLFLSQIANKAARKSFNPLTFYNSYHFLTGIKFEEFYRTTMQDMIKSWKEKEAKLNVTPYEVKNVFEKNDWVNYLYPQAVGKDKFFSLKKGLSYIDQFVLTDGKEEKTVFYPGALQNEYPYKVRNGRVAIVEWELDPRWGYRDYSRIKVFDLKEKEFVADLRKTKGRLAVLDFTGEFILYIDWDEKQGQRIIVRKLDGKEVYRLNYSGDKVITSLDWLTHNEIVMVVKDMNDQKEVVKLSLLSQEETSLLPKTVSNLGFISTHQERVLIESPASGIDNIFEVAQGSLVQITSSRFGAYSPSVYQDQLVYSDYTDHGMNIVIKKLPWDEKQESSDSFVPFFEKFALLETKGDIDKDFFNSEKYPVTDYSQLDNAINFHSWVLIAPPLSSIVTAQAISRDILNKFTLAVGANYDLNEQEAQGFVTAAWSHWYPVLDLRAAYGGRNEEIRIAGVDVNDEWEEGTLEGGIQVPWKKITGRFLQSFNLRSFGKIIKVTSKRSTDIHDVSDGVLFSPGAEAQYSFISRTARRDLNPSLGIALLSHFEEGKDINGEDMKGSLFSNDARLFLPGVMKHHSFFHQFAYERQRDDAYQYQSLILLPRGTKNVFLEESRKYSGNYMFPLFYPDWHISRYAYFKRISMNLFYDELTGNYRGFNYHAASTGWEVLLDTNFFRIFIPLTIGVRGSYVLHGEEKTDNYEVFLTTLGGYF
ncbi:MAG: hypothetical protein H0V66_10610 [Bdellovibrionales bacterium]|nr:hypothetical protein [Bdellovibrionales bacterium]